MNLKQYLTAGVGTALNQLFVVPNIQVDGSMLDAGATLGALQQSTQASIAAGGLNFQSSAAAAVTLSSLQNLYQKLTNGGAVTVTIDSAYNIVNNVPNAFNGETFPMEIFSSGAGTVATPTLSDTAVTLVGTTSITAGNRRTYQVQITQIFATSALALTTGTTFTSITQVGTTNNFTVALATNAIVPVVGQAVFITVTAGTLPTGWYPINKVTSATSFVIATPPGTVWTATAATLSTPALPVNSIYSPLLNITAVDSVAAVV